MRRMAPVKVLFHFPETEEGNKELARRVAELHASAVIQRIKDLDCSRAQKLELLDAIIGSKKQTPQSKG